MKEKKNLEDFFVDKSIYFNKEIHSPTKIYNGKSGNFFH